MSIAEKHRPQPDQDAPALRPHPSRLFVEPTTRCNLNCIMCVKQGAETLLPEGDIAASTFGRLAPALGGLEALVFSGIGEPLLQPGLEGFISQAKREMPAESWVGLQTNGRLLTPERVQSLAAAGLDKICLSVDALTPEVLGAIRKGADATILEQALAALRRVKQDRDIRVGVEVVLMRGALAELPRVLEWAGRRGADFALVTQMLPYDQAMTDQVIYGADTDASREHFRKWRARAREEGVDLDLYLGTLAKYSYSPDEQKTVDFVDRLKAEAQALDIPLNIRRLLEGDARRVEGAAEVLAQARETAAGLGMELELPALAPRRDRRCPFVEEGGAFVSWDGKVHPCYFLWHHYACYLDGRRKQVRPRVFGDLSQRDILDIWTDPAFIRFREDVLLYDYPFCGNCNLCPCDFIDQPEFESDCYTIETPCGDCPWCQGLLNCLH